MTTVLVDRDGVLCEEPEYYVKSVEELQVIPRSMEALRRLTLAGLAVVIVSNQSGVGRGIVAEGTLHEVTRRLLEHICLAGGEVAGIYYCTHTPEHNCDCRKPKPGMPLQAARELGFDLARAVMVGDNICDVEMAQAVGARSILVMTGQGPQHLAAAQTTRPEAIARDLLAAVPTILDWKGV